MPRTERQIEGLRRANTATSRYTSDGRRKSSQAHTRHLHDCPRCGRRIAGNGYYRHAQACRQQETP
jgi:hypothetical protein